MTKKNCSKCNSKKLIKEFSKLKRASDGLQSACKNCCNEYFRTKTGLIVKIYNSQKYTSKHRKHNPPSYSRAELEEWVLSQPNFDRLYQNWVESGYEKMLVPSVDRANDYKPYTIDNLLRVCTWQENHDRGLLDRKNGINNKLKRPVKQMNLNGTLVREYDSQVEAAQQNNIARESINNCCAGRTKTAGGFRWER